MFKKLKDKKGFTLVELIVVLVILAILAALLVPALTGYIDKAKNQSIIAETRQVVMAAQTLADEAYGKKEVGQKSPMAIQATLRQRIFWSWQKRRALLATLLLMQPIKAKSLRLLTLRRGKPAHTRLRLLVAKKCMKLPSD